MTAPTMPLILLLAVTALDEILSRILINPSKFAYHLLLLVSTFVGLYMTDARFLRELSLVDIPFDSWDARRHIELSIVINRVTYENATVGVFWAGTLPYYIDRKSIDFLGKSDAYIASLPPDLSVALEPGYVHNAPGHNKYDLTYSIQTLLPTYVEGFIWGSQDLTEWRNVHYVKATNEYVEFYLLKDSPDVNWHLVKQDFRLK